MTDIVERAGGCLCGAVRFRARHGGEVSLCHCSMCRRATGGPLFAVLCDGEAQFEEGSPVGVYHSSEQGERGFCQQCGSSLYFHHRGENFYAFTAGSFDDQGPMVLTSQIFIDDKPGFYALANDTPRYRKGPKSRASGEGEQPAG
ncbi:GFA family protein [Kushneria aurantia]|uniref:GFA family protein n=1 Tax=Kushneria aurantia TaxID=504092 RepID=A0ABV6G040_9GAMM|nr:GFA family protein [Kushneria aurantia]